MKVKNVSTLSVEAEARVTSISRDRMHNASSSSSPPACGGRTMWRSSKEQNIHSSELFILILMLWGDNMPPFIANTNTRVCSSVYAFITMTFFPGNNTTSLRRAVAGKIAPVRLATRERFISAWSEPRGENVLACILDPPSAVWLLRG